MKEKKGKEGKEEERKRLGEYEGKIKGWEGNPVEVTVNERIG